MYHSQIKDMANRGTAKKMDLTDHAYRGAVYYIPHHEVMKTESVSTPMRIVFNSSASYMGQKLNDYWAKGPCVLNDMLTILLRFRENWIAIVGDISRMYNSIKIYVADQHIHRFLWRDLILNKEINHYLLKTVTFGDKPSSTIAIAALKKTAKLSEEKFPEECKIITDSSYADDIIFSVGNETKASGTIGNIERILEKGNFKIKHWIVSGLKDEYPKPRKDILISQPSEKKVLGLIWEPIVDVFKFTINLNFNLCITRNHHT